MIGSGAILILGATGMLGSTIFNYIALSNDFEVIGTYRANSKISGLVQNASAKLVQCDLDKDLMGVETLIRLVKPAVIINCIGVIKQRSDAREVLITVPINTVLPHRLFLVSQSIGARFIHYSTDCVFSGNRGNYTELDNPDAVDLYGLSKFLGEVTFSGALTLRTSIIGHELSSSRSLLDWFLSQVGQIKGYTNAYFSGLSTFEIARITLEIIKLHPNLSGLYHLAADKISKHDLLTLFNCAYGKDLDIIPDGKLIIDRSLNADKFKLETGYKPQSWDKMVIEMKDFKNECDQYIQR